MLREVQSGEWGDTGSMKTLFEGGVFVHGSSIRLEPDDLDYEIGDRSLARGGQTNGLCGAAHPRTLHMVTGLHTGTVPLRIELHDAMPALAADWEDVVEVSFTMTDSECWLVVFDWFLQLEAPPAGTYRARWCASGMDESQDVTRSEDKPENERYLLQLWPAPMTADAVIRQGSESAAYWHRVAAETPPPPTPEERAAQQAAQEREEQAAQAEQEAEWEMEQWGGRAPTDELLTIGGGTVHLAGLDRDLVDTLAALPAKEQRSLALWAAREACERAGLLDRDWIQAALVAVAEGGPLPALWSDEASLWAHLFPDEDEVVAEVYIVQWDVSTPPEPLGPEATAVDAVREASDHSAVRAVMGAVDALAGGRERPGEVVEDLRRRLAAGQAPLG